MTKPEINSYNDLIAEKERLRAQFGIQKQALKDDFTALKDSLNPIKAVAKSLGKLTTPDKSLGFLNTGLSFGVDMLLRKVLLRKSGWIVKLAAPFLVKNLVSHFAASKIKTGMPDLQNIIEKMPGKV
ncbi:hypothetical protein BH10BAC3_BH10BAC3_14620 [soil metagenome]